MVKFSQCYSSNGNVCFFLLIWWTSKFFAKFCITLNIIQFIHKRHAEGMLLTKCFWYHLRGQCHEGMYKNSAQQHGRLQLTTYSSLLKGNHFCNNMGFVLVKIKINLEPWQHDLKQVQQGKNSKTDCKLLPVSQRLHL